MNESERKAVNEINRIFGLKRKRGRRIYDPTAVRCYKCHTAFDSEVSGLEAGDLCPMCGNPLK